jgi:hypothetical protein
MIMRASGVAILFGLAIAALDPAVAGPAGPGTGGLALTRAAETYSVIEVRHRAGAAVAGAIAGGIIGGIIASQGGFGYPPAYPYPYYQPYPAYPGNPAIAYCMNRFRSYDPYSMTYLGYDGYRHPCP